MEFSLGRSDPAAARYEARVCSKDEGIIYRVVRGDRSYNFDGYDHSSGLLLDAKHYLDDGWAVRAMSGQMGMRQLERFTAKLEQDVIARQLYVANGRRIQWRRRATGRKDAAEVHPGPRAADRGRPLPLTNVCDEG